MTDFNIRSDSVDVEQIMLQIRARIREKRGVDYTEEEVRELANVKLEKLLDPKKVRSDLVEHYRRQQPKQPPTLPSLPAPPPPEPLAPLDRIEPIEPVEPLEPLPEPPPFLNYTFEDHTIYYSSRGVFGTMLGLVRGLLNPILKVFFNPNPIIQVLNLQAKFNQRHEDELAQHRQRMAVLGQRIAENSRRIAENSQRIAENSQRNAGNSQRIAEYDRRFAEYREQFNRVPEMFTVRDRMRVPLDDLNYELLNNLVVEITRLGIEVKNLKMRVESLSSRLDFDERRGRALEGVVQYKPGAVPPSQLTGGPPVPGEPGGQPQIATQAQSDTRRTRRRRRRGRRRGAAAEPRATNGAPTSDITATSVEPAPDVEPEGGETPGQ